MHTIIQRCKGWIMDTGYMCKVGQLNAPRLDSWQNLLSIFYMNSFMLTHHIIMLRQWVWFYSMHMNFLEITIIMIFGKAMYNVQCTSTGTVPTEISVWEFVKRESESGNLLYCFRFPGYSPVWYYMYSNMVCSHASK